MRLDPVSTEGPIYMILTELDPDTIMINEVDRATHKLVMTSSVSLVTDPADDNTVMQLILVSHEVVASPQTGKDSIIKGHQIWRFRGTELPLNRNRLKK